MIVRRFLVFLIHQHFLCHGGWSLSTPAMMMTSKIETIIKKSSSSKSSSTAQPPLSLVSSSEATLLTTSNRTFSAEMQQRLLSTSRENDIAYNEVNGSPQEPYSGAEVPSIATKKNAPANKNKIVSVRTNCTRDLFEMRIDLDKSFRGILYAKDFPFECRTRGSSGTNVTLKLPTSGCGVRSEAHNDGNLEFSVKIMVQMDEKLRQSADILRTIRCLLPQNAMGMNLLPNGELQKSFR